MNDVSQLDLIRAAVLAPSPDNNQPWRFSLRHGQLSVYLDRTRTLPSDVRGMFDLMGIGAAIENACIAARQRGLEPTVTYEHLPAIVDDSPLQHLASVDFHSGGRPDPLHEQLDSRCTCRKPYAQEPLPQEQLDRLFIETSGFRQVQLDWITDHKRRHAMARLVAAMDQIRFQYEDFHNELFRMLRFSAEEAERTKDGLDLRTLELPPGFSVAVKFLRPWSRMKWLHRLKLTGMLAAPSAMAVRNSGALGIMSVSQPDTDTFLEAGRGLQRVWLAADSEQLAFQPLGSPPIFFGNVQILGGQRLSGHHVKRIQESLAAFHDRVPTVRGRVLFMVFRLGIAARPQVRSLRRPAEEVFLPPDDIVR